MMGRETPWKLNYITLGNEECLRPWWVAQIGSPLSKSQTVWEQLHGERLLVTMT
jgi:alpha-L-arabinofuranosidase